jgi:hypothetical protein
MKPRHRRQRVQQYLLHSRIALPQWRQLPESCRTQLVALLMELLEQHAKMPAVTEARGGSDE